MLFCTRDQITDLLLADYVKVCEGKNPGLVERTIEAVSGEIATVLSYRYPQPWPMVPELIRYIASVISAYRVVEAITTLVDSESEVGNEWVPLQKQWKYCTDLLKDIRDGKLKLPLDEANPDREEPTFAVVSPKPFFDFRGF
ncbi:phage protein Gp36 family protein [uncultured Bilophila sp.]|uniref:phage protein Gp36 family protein n=1 Tax=uncultured Bilophila sp. TaxID=529385 RepID=UPI00280ACE5C|nr:phage protein Gp36 family protein [uncultured Bilophila sp.]